MKFKGFIFDFNGVLLWDSELHEVAYSRFAEKLRGRPFSREELDNKMHGVPNRKILEYILQRELSDEEAYKLTQEKESTYRKAALELGDEYTLSPGASDLLNWLRDHSIPRTIATSSEKTNVDFFIKQFNLGRWFDISQIIFDDGSFPGKPNPDIYLIAASTINVAPNDCVVVEDAISGIKAAHAAGIGRIYALGSGSKHEELSKLEGVFKVIESLKEIEVSELF